MTTQSKSVQQLQSNRYDDLTDTQRAHVDAYITALASGQQTEITHAVKYWVEEARAILGTAPIHQSHARGSGVRHALAMIVDATVRPTLDD